MYGAIQQHLAAQLETIREAGLRRFRELGRTAALAAGRAAGGARVRSDQSAFSQFSFEKVSGKASGGLPPSDAPAVCV